MHRHEVLRLKCIPYFFFTTSAARQHVIAAYSKSVEGFFVKPNTYVHMVSAIRKIIEYWQECESPDYIK